VSSRPPYGRVLLVWVAVLALLYVFQEFFT
jgi:hypothetical protein